MPIYDELVKSRTLDGEVKSSPPQADKARESEGMRRTYLYAAMTEDEAESRAPRDRWTFYDAVIYGPGVG